jgi:hypothetical protein
VPHSNLAAPHARFGYRRRAEAQYLRAIALKPRMDRARTDLDLAHRKLEDVLSRGTGDDPECGEPQPSSCEEPF